MDNKMGEFIGWYIAEGSYFDVEDGIQLSMCVDEKQEAEEILSLIRERFGIIGRIHIYGNSLLLMISSKIIVEVIKRFIRGKDAKTKRLTREAFFYGEDFLLGILMGYLKGDGHWDVKNRRWRLGFARNEGLIMDIGIISHILGYRLRFSHGFVPYQRGQAEIIRGSIRENINDLFSYESLETLGLSSRGKFAKGQYHSLLRLKTHYKIKTRKRKYDEISILAHNIIYGHIQTMKVTSIHNSPLSNYHHIQTHDQRICADANGTLVLHSLC